MRVGGVCIVQTNYVVLLLNGFGESEETKRFFDVDYAEDSFLDEEADHLRLLHYRVSAYEAAEGGRREGIGV